MLTLRPMFDADEQTATTELMRRIQVEEPDRPSTHHRSLSRDLESIVLKCLEKDRERRYVSAGELAADLGRFLAGEPVHARPVGAFVRVMRHIRRHFISYFFGGLLVVFWMRFFVINLHFHGLIPVPDWFATIVSGYEKSATLGFVVGGLCGVGYAAIRKRRSKERFQTALIVGSLLGMALMIGAATGWGQFKTWIVTTIKDVHDLEEAK